MSTAQSIIEGALRLLAVKRPGISASTTQLNDGLESFNDWITELHARNIKIPVNKVSDVTSDVGEDDWTRAYLKAGLAMRLAPEYTIEPSNALIKMWADTRRTVLAHITDLANVAKPDILPIGSGNQDITWNNREFYPDIYSEQLATESDSSLEDNTGGALVESLNDSPLISGG